MKLYDKFYRMVLGNPFEVRLEERLFNFSTLAISLVGLFSAVINIYLKVPLSLTLFACGIAIISLLTFYISRYKEGYHKIKLFFYLVLYFGLCFAWIENGGVEGPSAFAFIFIISIVITTNDGKDQKYHITAVFTLMAILLAIQVFMPDLIVPYVTDEQRIVHIALTLVMFGILAAVNIYSLKLSYAELREYAAKKNNELKASLVYASSIQDSLLEHPQNIISRFRDAFLVFLPRDIVSGDFYWYREFMGRKMIAIIDGSGHGVPSALMSTLTISFLNEILLKDLNDSPEHILRSLRVKLKLALSQRYEQFNAEGFEIMLWQIDESNRQIAFSGAQNQFYVIRDGQILRFKSDNLPLAADSHDRQFDTIEFELMEGDRIYLFTDGYINQPGGTEGKKYNLNRFRELLLETCNLTMREQRRRIMEEHVKWKGKAYHQEDDILLVGIQV